MPGPNNRIPGKHRGHIEHPKNRERALRSALLPSNNYNPVKRVGRIYRTKRAESKGRLKAAIRQEKPEENQGHRKHKGGRITKVAQQKISFWPPTDKNGLSFIDFEERIGIREIRDCPPKS